MEAAESSGKTDRQACDERAGQLDQLRRAYESGVLDEMTYRAAAAALEVLPAVSGDVGGDVVTGEKRTGIDQQGQQVDTQVNIARLYQVYRAAPGPARLTEREFQRVLADYLDWVVREYGFVRLHGLQTLQGTGPLDKPLAQVYTSLVVRHRPAVAPGGEGRHRGRPGMEEMEAAAETQPVDMADLLTLGERIAIVGGAGCGKTTYLAFVAASLAAALRGQRLDLRLKPPAPDAPLPVPLLAPLRLWQVYRDQVAQKAGLLYDTPDAVSLGAFLLWCLRGRYKNFPAAGDFFERLLRGQKQGCLILLDGLDEVVSPDERRAVRGEVERLLRSQYPGNRCLVTAREAGYRDAPFGGDFRLCHVQPMDDEQIAALVRAWCSQIYPQPHDCQAAGDDLLGAIQTLNAERAARGQPPLVATPLMVTMVVSVRYSRRELPRERAKLYDACVEVILSSEYSGQEGEAGARRAVVFAGGPPDKQREWLSLLAFAMHQGGQAGTSQDEAGVRAVLAPALRERGELALLDPFLAAIRHRGGLFEERGDRFQFVHLTFQEFLAAQSLARGWAALPAGFLAGAAADDWWREVLLLTVGSLGAPAPYDQRQALIAALCQMEGPMAARLAAAELAALGLRDLTDPEPTLLELAQGRLASLLEDPGLVQARPAARAAAGRALAFLGDPRDLAALLDVPAGPFLMGSGNVDQHELSLPAFRIGRYPVTNSQYAAFVAAGGYRERRFWTPDGWRRREREGWEGPKEYDAPFDLSNHPVVGISWYEALAFCGWLTEVWRAEGRIGRQELVRLPSEAEWEKAARGDQDRREYPWGDQWDETRCNTRELGLGGTTPVGIFPDGASPYGCLDMAGNVWEWTRSLWGEDLFEPAFKYPYDPADGREDLAAPDTGRRVVRGGSFLFYRYYARCAYRFRGLPLVRNDSGGFRVVVSPISPPSAL